MRVRPSIVVSFAALALAALALAACSSSEAPTASVDVVSAEARDETAVLGVQIERVPDAPARSDDAPPRPPAQDASDGSADSDVVAQSDAAPATADSAPASASAPAPPPGPAAAPAAPAAAPAAPASPRAKSPQPSATATATPGADGSGSSARVITRPAPTPTPASSASPPARDARVPAGTGWSYDTLTPKDDGWAHRALEPSGRTGATSDVLFVRLAWTESEADFGRERFVRCLGWFQATPDEGLDVDGTVTVEVRQGDVVLAAASGPVQARLQPGGMTRDTASGPPVRVHVDDGQDVTCSVRYTPNA